MHRNSQEESISTKLQRIEELAKQGGNIKFTSLAHLLGYPMLRYAWDKLNKQGAPGVDGITMEQFEKDLDQNLKQIEQELKEGKYRAANVRRAYIPKVNGKLRPLGIPTIADRIVQRATGTILTMIYENYFMDISYGFRPQRSAHDALAAIKREVSKKPINWIVDVDIKGYFDHVNHTWLIKFLKHRIVDKSLLRIITKWLKAGILENGVVVRNEQGTPQGGPISPLLANIYLHYVLDLWFEKKYKPTRKGYSFMVRYADDFIVGFEHHEEARQFLEDLKRRLEEFNLQIAEDKTKIVAFGRKSTEVGKIGPGNNPRTFNFLGFTHYMKPARSVGRKPTVRVRPKKESRNKFLRQTKEWLREHMHTPVGTQRASLTRRLRGYYNYFGLEKRCLKALLHVKRHVERLWIMTLRKRSQKHNLWWWRVQTEKWFRLPEPYTIFAKDAEVISGSRMP